MMQGGKWLYLIEKLEHLFNAAIEDEPIFYEVNVIDLLYDVPGAADLFRKNPSNFVRELLIYLRNGLSGRVLEGCKDREDKKALMLYKKMESTFLQVKSLPFTKKIYKTFSELNSDCVGDWVVLTGTVIQAMQKKTLDKSKIFNCAECGAQYRVKTSHQNSYRFEMPTVCTNMVQKEKNKSFIAQLYSNFHKRKSDKEKQPKQNPELKLYKCGSFKFNPEELNKICVDYQELRIQEQFQFISSGKIPQTLTVVMEGNITGATVLRPGDDITITGILSYRYKKLQKEFKILPQLIVVANNIVIEKSGNYVADSMADKLDSVSETQMSRIYDSFPLNYYEEYELTSRERIIIKQLEFRREIIQSFCPGIYGRDMVKLGLLISLLGGVSIENESSKIRGHSHVLLVGEPGTGKSVLLKETAKLADRSFLTNGIGTTSAGLSVSYFKEGGDWMIEAGALVLADNGVCCIDELTLLSKKDEKSLLESMEQQTISSAKASVVGKLNARTTVICACNPIRPGQKYDQDVDLEANTGLSIPLLTRFDMIFIMKDERDVAEDAEKCEHILQKFCTVRKSSKASLVKRPDRLNLKALIQKCKTYSPELSSNQILSIYYTEERKTENKVKTARAFESLCRIAEAHAKLMLRETTILLDYITAICLTENRYFGSIEEYYAILDEFNTRYGTSLD